MKPVVRSGEIVKAYIKDFSGRVELIAKGGRLDAFFDKQKNQTILSGGRLYGFRDRLMSLLDECD